MKFLKLLLVSFAAITLSGCELLPFGQNSEQADPTLYHLTLSSNLTLNEEQSSQLKAVYGYGEPSTTIVEGVRDRDEIEELKKAGATDEDIAKAGKKQSDGTYYFFDQDPIYFEIPQIDGYKFMGMYDKDTDKYQYNPLIKNPDGTLLRWNMPNKDTHIEARYQKWTYSISFDYMEEDEHNPNTITSYCYIDDGVVQLQDATTTCEYKTFAGWRYQDFASNTGDMMADWILLEDGILPSDYYEETMRIAAFFEYATFDISFAFTNYIDPDTSVALAYDDVVKSISVKGNLTTIDGVPETSDASSSTPVTKDSEIKTQYGGWFEVFINLKPGYCKFYADVDGERKDFVTSDEYLSFDGGEITKDLVINIIVYEE